VKIKPSSQEGHEWFLAELKRIGKGILYFLAVVSVISASGYCGYTVGYKEGELALREEAEFIIEMLDSEINRLLRRVDNCNQYIIQYFHNIKGEYNAEEGYSSNL